MHNTCFLLLLAAATLALTTGSWQGKVKNNSIQCTRTPVIHLRKLESTEVSAIYGREFPLAVDTDANYICTADFLSNDTVLQHLVPAETIRLLIICNRSVTAKSHLPLESVKHLINLQDLGIINCKFDASINITQWLGGLLIKRLFVENSKAQSIGDVKLLTDTFYDNPKLRMVVLSRNELRTVPTSLLCKWTTLERLWLNKNHFSDTTFLYTKCHINNKQPILNLEELDLSYNNLTSISSELLTTFPLLHSLTLHHNKIANIAVESPLVPPLQLRYSPITSLVMNNNELKRFDLCGALHHLNFLDLSSNSFECVSLSLLFHECISIEELQLNNVWEIGECKPLLTAVSSVPQLFFLEMGNNNIQTFDFEIIPKTLRYLEICNSHVSTINDMQNVTSELNLIEITIEMNNITNLVNFSFPPTLIALSLELNQIANIHPVVFSQCVHIISINLNQNRLRDISGLFLNLPKLCNLFLENNNIMCFDYSMIPYGLYHLSLSNNDITEITDDRQRIFEVNLRYLNLSDNHFITLNQNSFPPSILTLDLSNCEVDSSHENTLKNLNLNYFVVVENFTAHYVQNPYLTQTQAVSVRQSRKLDEVCTSVNYHCSCKCDQQTTVNAKTEACCNTHKTPGFGSGFYYFEFTLAVTREVYCFTEIICVNLCNSVHFYNNSNQYKTMNTLYCNTSIDTMDFNHEEASVQRSKTFFSQRGLLLNNMSISGLKEEAFAAFQQLQILNLDSNLLTKLHGLEFRNMTDLRKLYLNGNLLSYISDSAFNDLNNLTLLEIKQNRLEHLHRSTFVGLKQLRRLHLDENYISTLPHYTFINLTLLRQLRLSMNQIKRIESLSFVGLVKLLQLYINGNKINAIEDCAFNEMTNLEEIYLDHNDIRIISNFTFCSMDNLHVLHLYDNQIAHIDMNSFADLSSLNQLLLHSNLLTKWSVKLPKHLVNLTLAQNHFPCDCKSIFHLREQLSQISKSVAIDYDKNRCIFPIPDLTQHTIKNITEKDCYNGITKIFELEFIITAITSVFLLCGVTALYGYRLEVQVLLYAKFNVRFWANNRENDRNKIYDAFLSYSNDDRVFIAEQLLPNLEKRFRVCVHERDFLVGAYIADTIIDVVEKSCRTLVILTPSFPKSEWCLYEFKSAHYQGLKDKCCRLIIILLEDVDINELNSELRAYMRTNTFLRWNDPLFWQKLMYSMPDVQPTGRD